MTPRQKAMPFAIQIAERVWEKAVNREMKNVMVALSAPEHNRRHLRLYRDKDGLYVRLGRGALMKRYLKDMAGARIVDAALDMVVFYEY